MKAPIYQVDAFTQNLFGGNPAAVCFLDSWPEDILLQKIGAENNLSETAFVVKKENEYELRWFTPLMEIDLCGHATLAAAHVLFKHLDYKENTIKFRTKYHGTLTVREKQDLIELEFPASVPEKIKTPDILIEGLGITPQETYQTRDILAVFEDEKDIVQLTPDFIKLKELQHLGIIVTAKGNSVDFVSRFFAPKAGINEDPVTGSAHTSLIPYWAKSLNKNKLSAHQISSRKGELHCEYKGDKVLIAGNAITYLEGFISI